MNVLKRLKFFIWKFGHFKVPLIGHLRPQLLSIDDKKLVIKIRLTRRTKNHLNSMYFGALSIGADLAGGLFAFYYGDQKKYKMSLAFKSFQAQFLRRPESDVYFVCEDGELVKTMLEESAQSGQRVNQIINVKGYTHYFGQAEEVADFKLELSIKVIK